MFTTKNMKLFIERIDEQANGCWIYTGPVHTTGYGVFHVGRDKKYAHVFMMEYMFGKPEAGLEIDHLCMSRDCVNPIHLEYVPRSESLRRSAENYINRDGKFWTTKLDIRDVVTIRRLRKEGYAVREIAKLYPCVTQRSIYNVIRGKTWSHIQ